MQEECPMDLRLVFFAGVPQVRLHLLCQKSLKGSQHKCANTVAQDLLPGFSSEAAQGSVYDATVSARLCLCGRYCSSTTSPPDLGAQVASGGLAFPKRPIIPC